MRSRHLDSWVLVVLLALISLVVEAREVKRAPAKVSAAATEAPWAPEPFSPSMESLPPGYGGLDPRKFGEWMVLKWKALKKDEFETTQEYRTRTADVGAIIAPLNQRDFYAFEWSGLPFKYDADAQAFTVGGVDDGYVTCKESQEPKGWTLCSLGEVRRTRDSYVATNAYGASMVVERVAGSNIGLALSASTPLLGSVLSHGSLIFTDKVPFGIDGARAIRGKSLSVLVFGRIPELASISGSEAHVKPTRDNPKDVFILIMGIPFEVKGLIYYVKETGVIIGRRLFD